MIIDQFDNDRRRTAIVLPYFCFSWVSFLALFYFRFFHPTLSTFDGASVAWDYRRLVSTSGSGDDPRERVARIASVQLLSTSSHCSLFFFFFIFFALRSLSVFHGRSTTLNLHRTPRSCTVYMPPGPREDETRSGRDSPMLSPVPRVVSLRLYSSPPPRVFDERLTRAHTQLADGAYRHEQRWNPRK